MNMQSVIRFIYPPQCLACGTETDQEFALCGSCWGETPFISGLVCNGCGMPVPGDVPETVYCDACILAPRPWHQGRAAVLYDGTARRLVLALKHGDRLDLTRPMAKWLVDAAKPIGSFDIVAPVPLHRRRLFTRKYNQAGLLAQQFAKLTCTDLSPDLMRRIRATQKQEGMSRELRYSNQRAAFAISPRHKAQIENKSILLIDDVMTSGATLSACTEACYAAGAELVNVLVLARVARDA